MKNKITIHIVSDSVCPWCVVGSRRLEKAINELGIEEKVDLIWEPFELNPDMDKEGKIYIPYLCKKYNLTREQVLEMQRNITRHGLELGFKFDYYEEMKTVNTRDGHILLDFAKHHGKQTELQKRLFLAHFSERKNISDREVLKVIVQEVGLDWHDVSKKLDDNFFHEKIQRREDYWISKGVNAVPTMFFNESIKAGGAYPVETYKEILTELLEKE